MEHNFRSSRHLKSFEYNPETKTCVVEFKNGKKYSHAGIPQEAIDNWVGYTRSPGQFYHQVIGKYRKVTK